MRVYISGGMHGNWRKNIRERFQSFSWIDPCDHGMTKPEQYTIWDLVGISNCDILFAYMDKDNPSGYGLMLEIGYALGLRKPVIFVDEKEDRYMAIARESASYCTNNLEDGLLFLSRFGLIYG